MSQTSVHDAPAPSMGSISMDSSQERKSKNRKINFNELFSGSAGL